MSIPRPDLFYSNLEVAKAIAYDGSHFRKHGRELCARGSQRNVKPIAYARMIADLLNDPATYGFSSRVAPKYLQLRDGTRTPNNSSQTYYNPNSRMVVIVHLTRDETGAYGVAGTAYQAHEGHNKFLRLIESSARAGNHSVEEIRRAVLWSMRKANEAEGGRNTVIERPRQEHGLTAPQAEATRTTTLPMLGSPEKTPLPR